MTTFKDELVAKVKSVRNSVKENAIIMFSEELKIEMMKVASRGETNGSIHLDPEEYTELGKILLLSDDITYLNTNSIYSWFLRQFKEKKMFDGIDMILNEDDDYYLLEFNWYLLEFN